MKVESLSLGIFHHVVCHELGEGWVPGKAEELEIALFLRIKK